MKRILALILSALLIATLLAGCSRSETENPSGKNDETDAPQTQAVEGIDGTYIVKEIAGKPIQEYMQEELEESEMSMDEYLSFIGISSLEEFLVLTINKDGTASVQSYGMEASAGTWTQDGDKITVVTADETVNLTRVGSDLEVKEDDGQWFVFTKKAVN